MLGKLPFRSKLILVVSVPLFALVGLAGVTIHSRFDALSNQQQYGHLLPAFDALTHLGRAAADEREERDAHHQDEFRPEWKLSQHADPRAHARRDGLRQGAGCP